MAMFMNTVSNTVTVLCLNRQAYLLTGYIKGTLQTLLPFGPLIFLKNARLPHQHLSILKIWTSFLFSLQAEKKYLRRSTTLEFNRDILQSRLSHVFLCIQLKAAMYFIASLMANVTAK